MWECSLVYCIRAPPCGVYLVMQCLKEKGFGLHQNLYVFNFVLLVRQKNIADCCQLLTSFILGYKFIISFRIYSSTLKRHMQENCWNCHLCPKLLIRWGEKLTAILHWINIILSVTLTQRIIWENWICWYNLTPGEKQTLALSKGLIFLQCIK